MIAAWAIFHLLVAFWMISAFRRVRGLLGGYGQGVWGGPILEEAIDNEFNAILTSGIVVAVDAMLVVYVLFY